MPLNVPSWPQYTVLPAAKLSAPTLNPVAESKSSAPQLTLSTMLPLTAPPPDACSSSTVSVSAATFTTGTSSTTSSCSATVARSPSLSLPVIDTIASVSVCSPWTSVPSSTLSYNV